MPRDYRQLKVGGKSKLYHRHLMEQLLGRELLPHETVHHINEDTKDNRPENLAVMDRGEHIRLHKKGRLKYTPEFVLDEIRRVSQMLGRRPKCRKEFCPATGIAHTTVDRMFGSWINATNKALAGDLPRNAKRNFGKSSRIDDAKLIADFHRVWRIVGRKPTAKDYSQHGRWSYGPFYSHFGRWGDIPAKE
jgi:hypothetical protein